jgi:hypothetical protein
MKTTTWLIIGGVLLVAAPWLYQAHQADLQRNAKRVTIDPVRMKEKIDRINPGPDWHSTNITRIEKDSVSVTLLYRSNIGQARAEIDTTAAARAILAEMVTEGIHPSEYWVFVFVTAQQDGIRGETGGQLVRPFGTAHYDFNNDQIIYEPWSK